MNRYDKDDQRLDKMLSELAEAYDEALMAEAESRMPEGFEERMKKHIESLSDKDRQEVPMNTAKEMKGYPQIRFFRRYAAAAVAGLIIFGCGWIIKYNSGSNYAFTDTCQTPEEAEKQLNRALAMISQRTSSGLQEAREQIDRGTIRPKTDYSKYIDFTN